MGCLQGVAPNSFPLFPLPQTRVSRVLRASNRRSKASSEAAFCRPAALSARTEASALGSGNYPTALILLRHRFLVYVSSHHQTVVLDVMPIPLLHQNPSGTSPVLRTAPPKNSPKNFWKGDNICHIFCVIIEAKENTHARNQSL